MSNHSSDCDPAWTRGAAFRATAFTFFTLCVIYATVNHIAGYRAVTAWDPKTMFMFGGESLDRTIPVLPASVHLYNTLLLSYWLPACVAPIDAAGRRQLLLLLKTLVGMLIFASMFFLLLPAQIDLRDQVRAALAVPGVSPFDIRIFAFLHSVDAPYNSWPCLHIAQPILIAGTVSCWHWPAHRLLIIILWVWCAGIGISILTTKQHFIWDVLTGTLLGFMALILLRRAFAAPAISTP